MSTKIYKFAGEDPGFCRVYYRKDKCLYCLQDESCWGNIHFKFYRCSKDGEPSYEVKFPDQSQLDKVPENVDRKIKEWESK